DTTQSLTEALGDSAKTDAEGNQSQDEQRKKFERENPFFAVLTPPSQDQFTSQSTSPVVGYALPTDTAQVNAYLRLPEVRPLLPADVKLLWTAKPDSPDSPYLTLIAIANTRDGVAPLTGDAIVDTKQDFDPDNNQPIVSMSMNVDGAKIWRKMTGDNKGRSVAVVLDNLVYTYPTVNQEIPNGQSVISGNFTVEEAADLANVLKAGKLRAPVRIEGGEIVGPSLGVQTTERGLISFVLGFLAVVGFMVAYYRGSGVVASLALVLNLVFIVGVSAAFNIAMTLPGIAGIILSLAMAVDANVLIYERIREELEAGRSFRPAIAAGFKNALSSIIDGNVTTLITAIILTWVGQGPVRGFGVTLIIGILTSMVSAVIITRMMLDYRSSKSEKTNLSFGVAGATRFFKRSGLNLVGARKRNYALLVGLCLAVAVCIGGFGFKLGVDFLGGRQYLVEFADAPKDLDVVRADLKAAFEGNEPVVKTIGASQQLLITTAYLQEQPDADEQVETKLLAGLSVHFAAQQPTILRRTTIGPTVARDIRDSAFKAVALSLLGIFLYIFIRFRRWQFGVSAVISLAFNVLIVLGLFSLLGALNVQFSVEIDQVFIAAVLTIVGYTINDTVVVFDRIRENLDEHRSSSSLAELYRRALNDTLSRTVITATSVLLTSAIMFFIAGTVLQGFMLAIFMGIIIGTFSTLFLASPLSLDLLVRFSGLSKPKQALATS
ncbi:MAG: protein translocase subunit SecD, partial [Bacteroidia bacterium]|nr:protein translocase subunit SecD [Bacteroidia bacterium]